jgi:hypothetical protein
LDFFVVCGNVVEEWVVGDVWAVYVSACGGKGNFANAVDLSGVGVNLSGGFGVMFGTGPA